MYDPEKLKRRRQENGMLGVLNRERTKGAFGPRAALAGGSAGSVQGFGRYLNRVLPPEVQRPEEPEVWPPDDPPDPENLLASPDATRVAPFAGSPDKDFYAQMSRATPDAREATDFLLGELPKFRQEAAGMPTNRKDQIQRYRWVEGITNPASLQEAMRQIPALEGYVAGTFPEYRWHRGDDHGSGLVPPNTRRFDDPSYFHPDYPYMEEKRQRGMALRSNVTLPESSSSFDELLGQLLGRPPKLPPMPARQRDQTGREYPIA